MISYFFSVQEYKASSFHPFHPFESRESREGLPAGLKSLLAVALSFLIVRVHLDNVEEKSARTRGCLPAGHKFYRQPRAKPRRIVLNII
jgi:hypothetical protein